MLAIEREVDEYGGISQAMQHARQRAWERERAKIRRDLWRLMDRPRRAGRFIPVQRSAPKPFMLADGSHAYVAASHGQSVTLPYVSMLGSPACGKWHVGGGKKRKRT